MDKDSGPPFEALERLFHEPNRLAIVSELCGAEGGVPFTDLRDACRLTDGNLNRHLRALEEAGIVRVAKRFVDRRPLTTAALTPRGLARFSEYLDALSDVLRAARAALPGEAKAKRAMAFGTPAEA
jgi:DNA-binding transcriptional ArsR family regulator